MSKILSIVLGIEIVLYLFFAYGKFQFGCGWTSSCPPLPLHLLTVSPLLLFPVLLIVVFKSKDNLIKAISLLVGFILLPLLMMIGVSN